MLFLLDVVWLVILVIDILIMVVVLLMMKFVIFFVVGGKFLCRVVSLLSMLGRLVCSGEGCVIYYFFLNIFKLGWIVNVGRLFGVICRNVMFDWVVFFLFVRGLFLIIK